MVSLDELQGGLVYKDLHKVSVHPSAVKDEAPEIRFVISALNIP